MSFIVNNDSLLSRRAADVFFASLEESRAAGDGGAEAGEAIYVLELGVGVGLFARFWLDHFRDLSRKHGRDYYGRLCYILADKSPRMLLDVSRHGILPGHAGHYRLRVVDALKPEVGLPYDVCFSGSGEWRECGEWSARLSALHSPLSTQEISGGVSQLSAGLLAGGGA